MKKIIAPYKKLMTTFLLLSGAYTAQAGEDFVILMGLEQIKHLNNKMIDDDALDDEVMLEINKNDYVSELKPKLKNYLLENKKVALSDEDYERIYFIKVNKTVLDMKHKVYEELGDYGIVFPVLKALKEDKKERSYGKEKNKKDVSELQNKGASTGPQLIMKKDETLLIKTLAKNKQSPKSDNDHVPDTYTEQHDNDENKNQGLTSNNQNIEENNGENNKDDDHTSDSHHEHSDKDDDGDNSKVNSEVDVENKRIEDKSTQETDTQDTKKEDENNTSNYLKRSIIVIAIVAPIGGGTGWVVYKKKRPKKRKKAVTTTKEAKKK